jgi:hypothetical protein
MDQVTVCCQRALMLLKKIKKSTRNPNCQTIGQLADNSSSLVCRTSAELCCVKQLQENVCQSGMSTAMYVYTLALFQILLQSLAKPFGQFRLFPILNPIPQCNVVLYQYSV